MSRLFRRNIAFSLIAALTAHAGLKPHEFVQPPDDCRPLTWMHMMNGNASKAGLEADLRALDEAGVGGALIFSIAYSGIPEGNTPFNSQKFRDVLTHGVKVADELGLTIGLHNCDGWSSSGGPWVSVEDSMKHLVWDDVVVQGGEVEIEVPRPEIRYNYYRDIAVVAIPSNSEELKAAHNRPKVTSASGPQEAKKLFDGDLSNTVAIKSKAQKDRWIQFEYAEPFSARSLWVEHTMRDGQCKLLVSNDGKDFTEVMVIEPVRPGKRTWANESSFPEAVTARFFRFVFMGRRTGGVHDIDLAAYPRRKDWIPEACMSYNRPGKGPAIESEYIPLDRVKVLHRGELKGHSLSTQLPEGSWRIMRFGYTTTGAQNTPATNVGRGLECDKLDASALDRHFEAYMGKVIEESGPLVGKSLLFSEIDSYEMGWQNWTDGFDEIYQKEMGYDLTPFLPALAGHFISDEATVEAVCADFRSLVANMMTENYFQRFTDLCNEHGMKSYIEPYGNGPLNDLAVGGACDIPMGEFWMNDDFNVHSAVQSAHIYGKPVISAESFTSWADLNWKGHPWLMKEYGDVSWARGINEFMFHRYAHQANPHVAPGMTMGSVGSHIDRTQTWWYNAGKAWMKYNQRGSFMLRQGVPVSDVLVYIGDNEPNGPVTRDQASLPDGFNHDSCNTDVLINRITVKDGKMVLPEGTTYSILVLNDCDRIHLKSLKRLQALAEAGVTIVGKKPIGPIGYLERQTKADEFSDLANQLWGKPGSMNQVGQGRVLFADKLPADLSVFSLEPDLLIKEQPGAYFMHRKVGADDVYFVHHREKTPQTLHCSFRVGDRIPELWYPDTGKVEKQAQFAQKNGRTDMAIDLDPSGSVFVVFRESSAGLDPIAKVTPAGGRVILDENNKMQLISESQGEYEITRISGQIDKVVVVDLKQPIQLNQAWRVEFDGPGLTGDRMIDFMSLSDWKDHTRDDIKHFSGTAAYRTMLNVPTGWQGEGQRVYLDLGRVEIAAEIILNGNNVGILWKPPFVIDVTDQLVEGSNQLEVRVTNLWSNRLIGDEALKDTSGYARGPEAKMPEWYVNNEPMPDGPRSTFTTFNFYRKDKELLPSGLLGPVQLKQEIQKAIILSK